MPKKNSKSKKCLFCGKEMMLPRSIYEKTKFCSRDCKHDFMGRKIVSKCDNCGKEIKIKKTNISLTHNCSKKCYEEQRRKALSFIYDKKDEIIKRFENGEMLKSLAEEYGINYPRFTYYTKKWGIKGRPFQTYSDLIKDVGRKKTEKYLNNFKEFYEQGKISWRTAHKLADRKWKITISPCKNCDWDKAERDMHLIIPHLLEEKNAISLCPNCHRLAHRGKLNLEDRVRADDESVRDE